MPGILRRSQRPLRKGVLVALGFCALSAAVAAALTIGPISITTSGISVGSTTTTSTTQGTSTGTASGVTLQSNVPTPLVPGGSLPGAAGFNDVDCVVAGWCLAVGGSNSGTGIASLSTNSGKTWTSQSVPAHVSVLDSVSCVTILICVAVGEASTMHTLDGGLTWSSVAMPLSATTLLGVSCLVDLTCVAVGVVSQEARAEGGVIVKSVDAGAHWSVANIPDGLPGLGSVSCQVALCVAAGAAIVTSTNGGLSWIQDSADGGTDALTSVACASIDVCVALGPNVDSEFNSALPAVATISTNAGKAWSKLVLPAATGSLAHVACVLLDCVAAGPGQSASGPSLLLSSTNGGASWLSAAAPAGVSLISAISCVALGHCTVVGRSSTQSGASPVAASTTNGATWTIAGLTLP
jgi:hypothetical protein